MTNEFVKNRLLKYRDCLENKVLGETNYSRLIKLLKQDLYELKKIKTQNKYTKISFADCEKYINHKNVDFRAIANTLFLVFFDYYIVNITEPIQDEIFELMTEFVNCFLNRSMTYSQLTVHNLRSVTLLNSQNHQDGYYHSLYQKLLADDDIYQISEIVHDELFRQYCDALYRILILNNKFKYLIDFYNKANRIIEPKVLIEYFIELKDKINDKEFNYDLCKFLCQLFDRLDFSMCDSLANMNNTQNKEEKLINNLLKKGKTGISIVDVYLKIVGEIVEFFKEFEQDKILFEGFDKYTDDYYQKKRLTATPEEIDKINYDCIILTHYANSLSESKEKAAVQILSTVFDSINLNNSTAQVHNDIKISINCLDYMEKIIDYLILLRNANSKDYSKKDLDNKIYKLLNLYIRAKNINQKIIIPKSKDEEIVDFKEEIEKKLSKLQDVVVNVNKYLAEKQSDEEKQLIVKNFFKSAFDDYIKNGRQTNANSEYDIHDLSDRDIDLCYDAIKSNQSLINQIVTGEILIEPYVRARDIDIDGDYATGDYTNLVVCQIKAMERYVKEVLVQHHKEEIWKTKPQQGGARWPDEWKKTDKIGNKIRVPQNPTAEDLHDLECGGAIYALRKAYEIEEHVRDNFCISYKFYTKGIHEVRNGHLHIDKIKTVDDALMRRSQTAFWIMYLITKLGDKGKLTR